MASRLYDWKRFWCPREGVLNLSDGGFLFDPESEYAKYVALDVVPFEGISHLPCLALLGEPGIGKSTVMEDLRDAIQQVVQASGDRLLYVNLNEYGEESRLIQDVFDSAAFQEWLTGTRYLHLYLDSLDECRIRIPQVAAIILNRLKQAKDHLGRLRLRIACRTADWPVTLEETLPILWGKDGFGAFELAPLRRKDVQAAAEAEAVDVDQFFAELHRTETVPLAIKPITLRFLLSVFKGQEHFPTTRQELYEIGCTKLCEEANPTRQDLRLHGGMGQLSPEQRMAVASRIAAVSLFCRRPTIVTGDLPAQVSPEEAPIASLTGGHEPVGGGRFGVPEGAVREVLGTGLFSSRGPARMGFAHQTYAEFLAGRYLAEHGVSLDKVIGILRHPDDPDGHIVPQLYETAAWIAGMNRDVLRAIAPVDPQVLLRGDAGTVTDADRHLIVDTLLLALEERRATDRDWDLHRHYFKLKHPGLAEQLRAWIADKTKYFVARHVTIDIAKACECQELQSLFADIALDQTEVPRLRTNAAYAVGKIGDANTRRRLLPLTLGQGGDDPRDELKGCALRALWPGLISAEDLFQYLTLPKQENFHGAYLGFLSSDLLEHLGAADLQHALSWLKALANQQQLDYFPHRVADEIMVRAWTVMNNPPVLDALTGVCVEFFKHYHGLVHDNDTLKEHPDLFDDPKNRRMLAGKIVELSQDRTTRFELTGCSPRLIRPEDFEWCVEELRRSVGSQTEPVWAELMWSLFCWGQADSHRLDLVIDARGQSPTFRAESESFFTPVDLASERARKMKKDYEDAHKWQEKPPAKLLDPPPRQLIEHWLERSEKGETQAWWVMLRGMTLEETSTHYGNVFELDVTALPGWQRSDEAVRQRIVCAAMRYLEAREPFEPEHLFEGTGSEKDAAVYKALALLLMVQPEALNQLPSTAWEHWLPILFGPFGIGEDEERQKQLIAAAYGKVPNVFRELLRRIIMYQAEKKDQVSVLDRIEGCWDDRICQVVVELASALEHKPACWAQLMAVLFVHDCSQVRNLVAAKLSLPVPQEEPGRRLVLNAAVLLVQHAEDAGWTFVWPAVLAEQAFGREVLMEVAHGLHHNATEVTSKMTEDQLGDLFVWLVKEFPYSEDREYNGVYSPSKDDSVREFRDGVLRFLENRGTPGSVRALQGVTDSLPELDWLRSVVIEARRNALRRTWRPCTPAEFLQVATQPGTRLVRNAQELQDVLMATISRLEVKLQGETPAAPDLWDQTDRTRGQEKFCPKDENHLSDWIKRNLETEREGLGIVVAREVEIRRGEGSGTGEATDIHVTALVPGLTEGSSDQVRVIIEAKGCWHRELKNAMQTQLVARYLKDNQCQHGIYLVGWYVCPQWADSDYRKGDVPKWSLEEARGNLQKQAEDLSKGGLSIRSVVVNAALR